MSSDQKHNEWSILQPDEKTVIQLVRKAGLSDPVARLLVNRGITETIEAKNFLDPALKNLLSPDGLPDMDLASKRVVDAIKNKEKIVVYGDYDADGTTASALLYKFFEEMGAIVEVYQPDRRKEGYGLNTDALGRLINDGASLVVCVDLGIADSEAVEWASNKNLDIVVVDHHQVPEIIPKAVAVVDPLRSEEAEPYYPLSGVGLAFYLAASIRGMVRDDEHFKDMEEPDLKKYLDLVALGTIADMVPLTGVNRILVTHGLKELGAERRPGVAALKREAKLKRKRITAGQVAFMLGPRLNAAGRMADASVAVDLLTTEDDAEARRLAMELEDLNHRRQDVERGIVEEADRMIREEKLNEEPAIVIGSKNWHPGVLGIVASRIVDRYSIPTVVISFDGEDGKGSVRSVPGVNVWKALEQCSEHIVAFGGHEMAGGLMIEKSRFDDFHRKFREAVEEMKASAKHKVLTIDMEFDLEDLDPFFVRKLSQLAPHGMGNPEPLFVARSVSCVAVRRVGSNHLKFRVNQGNSAIDAIAFGQSDSADMMKGPVDLAFVPSISSYDNWEKVEIKVRSIRPAGESPEKS